MGDGAAERALLLRPLHVDVDPLVVAGGVGERVDLVLGDLQPVAGTKRLALRVEPLLCAGKGAHPSLLGIAVRSAGGVLPVCSCGWCNRNRHPGTVRVCVRGRLPMYLGCRAPGFRCGCTTPPGMRSAHWPRVPPRPCTSAASRPTTRRTWGTRRPIWATTPFSACSAMPGTRWSTSRTSPTST